MYCDIQKNVNLEFCEERGFVYVGLVPEFLFNSYCIMKCDDSKYSKTFLVHVTPYAEIGDWKAELVAEVTWLYS